METGGAGRRGRGGKAGQTALNFLKKLKAPHHLRQQLGGLLFLGLILFGKPSLTEAERQWILPLGAFVFALGAAGRVVASGYLVKNDFLTTTGPYGHVRNPIYVSNLFLGAGLVLLNGYYWAMYFLVLLYLVCYLPGMRVEEENLWRRYGAAFESYAKAVPLIWPRLKVVRGYGGDSWRWQAYMENKESYVTLGLLIGYVALIYRRLIA